MSGVDINTKNPKSNDTIFTTVGTLEMAQFLLANGVDPTIAKKGNATPLIHAVSGERSYELIRSLIDLGIDVNARTSVNDQNARLMWQKRQSTF